MVICIDEISEIPIYKQIRNQIVLGISDGRLQPGEQLPTVRALAEEIGINSMTVNKAYALLKQEGYIFTDRRNGARIDLRCVSQINGMRQLAADIALCTFQSLQSRFLCFTVTKNTDICFTGLQIRCYFYSDHRGQRADRSF